MTNRYVSVALLLMLFSGPIMELRADVPTCASASADSDGDGYGWENHRSCRIGSKDEELVLNIMRPTSPDNILRISWPVAAVQNPFAMDPITYEIWNNEKLLATVNTNRYQMKLSELRNNIGCISIRAVRGGLKSGYSSPVCYFVQS